MNQYSVLAAMTCIFTAFISGCAYVTDDTSEQAEPAQQPVLMTQPEQTQEKPSFPPGVLMEELLPDTRYQILGAPKNDLQPKQLAIDLCREIGNKLGSVDEDDCLRQNLMATAGASVEGRELAIKDYARMSEREPLGRVMVIGGIHGDEFSSVSVMFKWMDILNKYHSGLFEWRFIPVANPDGLLNETSRRQNANGVDLNRNFPTSDWADHAHEHWREKALKNPRRYPGETAASEPETQWLIAQITQFEPDVIISMHAPYHLVDYDGPPKAPDKLGSLYLRRLGVFPGSLGNYAGIDLDLPIVTVELASAGSMPTAGEISSMWDDLVGWLRKRLDE